jgi:hypothetical protein
MVFSHLQQTEELYGVSCCLQLILHRTHLENTEMKTILLISYLETNQNRFNLSVKYCSLWAGYLQYILRSTKQ